MRTFEQLRVGVDDAKHCEGVAPGQGTWVLDHHRLYSGGVALGRLVKVQWHHLDDYKTLTYEPYPAEPAV
jgi:hypothetical protein